MEQIKHNIETVTDNLNEAKPTLSKHQPTSTPTTIPREQHQALFAVINKARLLNGWSVKEAGELDNTIKAWAEILDIYKIPFQYYERLYRRAMELRISRLQDGKDCPQFTAELLAACWTGGNGLQRELEQERINSKSFLPSNAASVCRHCHGSNFREIERNGEKGAIRCNHEEI